MKECVDHFISIYFCSFPAIHTCQSVAFAYLLKTNLCPLVIKLFSPSLKLRSTPTGASPVGVDPSGSVVSSTVAVSHTASCSTNNTVSVSEKVSFPILVRLKRLITVIVEQYFHLLVSFLSS